jgi:hypothetical protein
MKKFVVETVQVIKRKYYVEVDNPTYIHDSITCDDIDPFSCEHFDESISSTVEVVDFPKADPKEGVNAATYTWDDVQRIMVQKVRWDLA